MSGKKAPGPGPGAYPSGKKGGCFKYSVISIRSSVPGQGGQRPPVLRPPSGREAYSLIHRKSFAQIPREIRIKSPRQAAVIGKQLERDGAQQRQRSGFDVIG